MPMPKPLRLLLIVLLWILVLGGGFVVFWVLDTKLFQPAIEPETSAGAGTFRAPLGPVQASSTDAAATHRG